jgi:4-hydroxybenzoate polyprenyltransferase/geranylgeranylglycerol-phosphate geranylgeranyltransferase
MFLVHDAGSNLLGALGDRDGDRAGGYATFPVVRGDSATIVALWIYFAGWVAIALTVPGLSDFLIDTTGYFIVLGSAVLLGLLAMGIVVSAPRPVPRPVCVKAHELIVVERLFLPAMVITGSSQITVLASIVAPSLIATITAARYMRRSYRVKSVVSENLL